MNDRDHELDQMLEPLRHDASTPLQRARWQSEVRSALRTSRDSWLSKSWPITAAMILGFILGAATFKFRENRKPDQLVQENIDADATVTYWVAKSE